jgi:hypothetical protein
VKEGDECDAVGREMTREVLELTLGADTSPVPSSSGISVIMGVTDVILGTKPPTHQ